MALARLASLILALAALAPVPGAASPPALEAFKSGYDIYVGGIWVGEVTLDATRGSGGYRADATFRTAGIVSFFVDERWRGETEGRIARGRPVPVRYLSVQKRKKGDKVREVTFRLGDPIKVSADPPMDDDPWSIDVADQAEAVDPATAVMMILAPAEGPAMCGQRIEVYDGKHRFAFDIREARADGDRFVCEGTHIQLAGYKPDKTGRDARRPFKVYVEERKDGLHQIVRVTTETPLGTAVMVPRD